MPTAAHRLRLVPALAAATLAGTALLALAPVGGPALPVTPAVAATSSPATSSPTPEPAPAASSSPAPTPCLRIGDLTCRTSTPGPTASPTTSPTRRATASPTPRRTHRATSSPRPRATSQTVRESSAPPVTEQVSVGPATGTLEDPKPAATPRTHAAASTGLAGHLGELITYVLVGAVLLGVGGATGLYLTRPPHEH